MKKNFAKSAIAMALTVMVIGGTVAGTASAARKPNLPPLQKENHTVDYADAMLGGLLDIVMDSFDNDTLLPAEALIP